MAQTWYYPPISWGSWSWGSWGSWNSVTIFEKEILDTDNSPFVINSEEHWLTSVTDIQVFELNNWTYSEIITDNKIDENNDVTINFINNFNWKVTII